MMIQLNYGRAASCGADSAFGMSLLVGPAMANCSSRNLSRHVAKLERAQHLRHGGLMQPGHEGIPGHADAADYFFVFSTGRADTAMVSVSSFPGYGMGG